MQGPNKGKRFYACARSDRNAQCSHFTWLEEEPQDPSGNESAGTGGGGGGGGESSSDGGVCSGDGSGDGVGAGGGGGSGGGNGDTSDGRWSGAGGSGGQCGDGSGHGADGGGGGGGEQFFDLHDKTKKEGRPESFRPSAATLQSPEYPSYDKTNLGRFRVEEVDLGRLAFVFFCIMFPAAVVNLLVTEVRNRGFAVTPNVSSGL